MTLYTPTWGRHRLELGRRTHVMGIVNITPDSFSDGGKFFNTDAAVAQAVRLVREGADIVDIGGESTRPFSEGISDEEELSRVIPVIEKLSGLIPVPISIDTTKARVAMEAVSAGAAIINDVSALRTDPHMAATAANCVPCFEHYFTKAQALKLTPEDIQETVDLSGKVRSGAQIAMRASIAKTMGEEIQEVSSCCEKSRRSCPE